MRDPTKMEEKTLWGIFNKFGGSARNCYHLAKHPEEARRMERSLEINPKMPATIEALAMSLSFM